MNSNTQNTSNVNTGNEDYLDKGTFPSLFPSPPNYPHSLSFKQGRPS